MLNIGRVGPGGHRYYVSQVAAGAEDYYVERGEEPGRWIGDGAPTLALDGRVEAADLKAVLEGVDPRTGEKLAGHPARKVCGFDLAFRAPKSVALAWGLTDDPEVAGQVKQAHQAAVAAAVKYLEREAGWTRRGAGGVEKLPGTGFVGAAFNHRTSRAGDPLLHTHVVVANVIRTADDGVWRTLDSRRLYKHAKTAGLLYQAELRHELTARLGVAWQPVVNGHADLQGLERDIIEAFSQRRAAIVARLDELGMDSPAAAQVATLTTRQAKEMQASEIELRAVWRARAKQLGFNPDRIRELLHQIEPDQHLLKIDQDALAEVIAGDEGLTGQVASFARRDAIQAVAASLPEGGTVGEIEQLADRLLEDGRLVAVGSGPQQLSLLNRTPTDQDDDGEVRFTTRSLLATETAAINNAVARRGDGVATINADGIATYLRRHGELGDDQAAMIRRLTTSGAGVEVVVGKAGSGKTHALKVAHNAWNAVGIDVVGCSLAARAARGLQEASGIPSMTVHRLLAACNNPETPSPLPAGGVLVVDEAGMVDTRRLAALLDHAQVRGTKVVLVGDPAQLPEIDAGGLFRGLTVRLEAVELTGNRRQTAGWERDAIDLLRDGDTTAALRSYEQHGRLTVTGLDELADTVLEQWQQLTDWHGADRVVMIARTRRQVAHLNAHARQRMVAAGVVSGPELVRESDGMSFAAGDRAVCLTNNRTLNVDNGTRATIVAIDTARHQIVIRPDGRDHHIRLPGFYVADGLLEHGYAITGHKAQGLTVDHALVVADEAIDGDWGYVAMSRGRHTNHLYLPDQTVDRTAHGRDPIAPDPAGQAARRLTRTRADTPLTSRDVYDPTETATRWQQLTVAIRQAAATEASRRELTGELDRLTGSRDYLETRIAELSGQLDDASRGLSRITSAGRRERQQLTDELDRLTQQREYASEQIDDTTRRVAGLDRPVDLDRLVDERDRLRVTLDAVAAQNTRHHERRPPEHLVQLLGQPPQHPEARTLWRDAAHQIEAFRTRWLIDHPNLALGDPLADGAQADDRRRLSWQLRDTVREMQDLEHPERGITRGFGLSR